MWRMAREDDDVMKNPKVKHGVWYDLEGRKIKPKVRLFYEP